MQTDSRIPIPMQRNGCAAGRLQQNGCTAIYATVCNALLAEDETKITNAFVRVQLLHCTRISLSMYDGAIQTIALLNAYTTR